MCRERVLMVRFYPCIDERVGATCKKIKADMAVILSPLRILGGNVLGLVR